MGSGARSHRRGDTAARRMKPDGCEGMCPGGATLLPPASTSLWARICVPYVCHAAENACTHPRVTPPGWAGNALPRTRRRVAEVQALGPATNANHGQAMLSSWSSALAPARSGRDVWPCWRDEMYDMRIRRVIRTALVQTRWSRRPLDRDPRCGDSRCAATAIGRAGRVFAGRSRPGDINQQTRSSP